jgi:hypoxanthine phosphoribosyltransferase
VSNGIDRSFQTDVRAELVRPEVGIASDALEPDDPRVGEIFLGAEELRLRVGELGEQIAADYADRDLLLVALLKASFVFLADLSRAIRISHKIDFVELAGYGNGGTGGHARVRLLQDTAIPLSGLDVLLVEDVVDTGLTLNYLCKLLVLRKPASLRVATLLDRPYRRLVEDLPVDYVGFTVPDEFFVGYGFDIDGRWRNLPDLRLARAQA